MNTLLLALTVTFCGTSHTLPPIGTEAYSASCTITHTFEDGSATAYCTEDGATYFWDSDGQPAMSHTPHRFPKRSAGWMPIN